MDKKEYQLEVKTPNLESSTKHFKKKSEINNLFKEYYQQILEIPSKEYEVLLKSCTEKLPITFRVNRMNPYYEFVECEIDRLISQQKKTSIKLLDWYPLKNLYIIENYDKKEEENKEIREFLIRENEAGIFRQELVSMIPVCLVNILESQTIIDFCAAPGNKTLQILEIMYNQAQKKNQFPSGLLITNELDVKRATMLIHLVQNHPTTNLVVTNTPAESFPSNKHIKPDIIFCDVPCSGDGTLRKNKGLRKRWKPDYGFNDHSVQIKILENAVRIAKEDGYIVYSTCSLNPIENEAVVCYILEKFKDKLELVDIKDKIMLSMKCSEGLTRWKVCDNWDKNGNKLEWAYEYSKVKKIKKYLLRESMFHEVYTLQNHSNNIFMKDPLNLRRCIRFYPHQNNTGGFFIAVLKKTADTDLQVKCVQNVPLNPFSKKSATIGDDLEEFMKLVGFKDTEKQDKVEKIEMIQEVEEKSSEEVLSMNSYVNFQEYNENFSNLKEFFDISSNNDILRNLHTLRTGSSKIFFFNDKLTHAIDKLCNLNINVMFAGTQIFRKERKESGKSKYRINHMGTVLFESIIKNQKMNCNTEFILRVLKERNVKIDSLKEEERKALETINFGCFIARNDDIAITCRKGRKNIRIMVNENMIGNLIRYISNYLLE